MANNQHGAQSNVGPLLMGNHLRDSISEFRKTNSWENGKYYETNPWGHQVQVFVIYETGLYNSRHFAGDQI
jgi:hypothetical protein